MPGEGTLKRQKHLEVTAQHVGFRQAELTTDSLLSQFLRKGPLGDVFS
jgi:beta-galactosidase/beta-glucuronidase